MTIVKLASTDGQRVWTRSHGVQPSFNGPTLLTCDNNGLIVVSPMATTNDDTGVGVRSVDIVSGTLQWDMMLIDNNSGIRGDGVPSYDGKKTPIMTGWQHAIGGVAIDGDHVYVTTPRALAAGEGYKADGGDVWAVSRHGTSLVQTATYSAIVNDAARWDDYPSAWYVQLVSESLTGTLNTSTRSTVSTTTLTDTTDHVYALPPTYSHSTPSLDVVNVAKVGQLQLSPDNYPPTSLIGQPGDVAGMLRAGKSGLYYCTDTYTDGLTNAWSMVEFTDKQAPRFKPGTFGYNPNSDVLCGGKNDRVGDLRICGTTTFVCTQKYVDTQTAIWKPLTPYTTSGAVIITPSMTGEPTTNADYPSGYLLTDYTTEISVAPVVVAYDLHGSFMGQPTSGQAIYQFNAVRTVTLAISTAGWTLGTPATDWAQFDIRLNDVMVGYVAFAPGSTTADSAVGSSVGLGTGTTLKITAPVNVDATLSDISFAMMGTVD